LLVDYIHKVLKIIKSASQSTHSQPSR